MKKISLSLILFFLTLSITAQNLSDKDIKEYETQIYQMVNYLQETVNFIGDPDNYAQEKDIIFKENPSLYKAYQDYLIEHSDTNN
jgi:hypothetical protein